MRYISTRGQAPPVSFLDAVLAGLAPDGGLYVPETWPALPAELARRAGLAPYAEVAAEVLLKFAGDDLSPEDCAALAEAAYGPAGAFAHPAVTPLSQLGAGEWLLELYHGPSLAFKDVAMQLIGPLYDLALARRGERLSVVCATSGDTGGAAVEALKGRERIDLFVLLPKGRVSEVQRRFMTASGAGNVHALEVEGDFDAAQAVIKALFADRDFAARAHLSGVNSINWARVVAQSVYFHIASAALARTGPVHFAVPTGNFGDAFAGYVAKRMGAPIGSILIATNANDILARALQTGRYSRGAQSVATLSPAMDIQVASNFERLVYEAIGQDGMATRRLYDQFAQSGAFDTPPAALAMMSETFVAGAADDAETKAAMASAWREGAAICPHTAVARAVGAKHPPLMESAFVTLATAHPAKFPETFREATGVEAPLPLRCADLFARPEQADTLPADATAVKAFIAARSRAWE